MTEPSKKHPQIEAFLEDNFGRTSAITSNRCLPPPIGCGGLATEFDNELSKREYTISGLCQSCQKEIFGS